MWLLVFDVAYQAWLLHLIKILSWSSLHWHSTVNHSPEWLSSEYRLVGVHFLAVVSNSVTVHILTSARVWGFSVRTGNWLSQHQPLSCDSVQIAHVEFKCMQICSIFHSSLFFMSPSQRQLGICSDDKFPFASRKNDSELLIKSTSRHARKTLRLFRPCPKPEKQKSNKEDNLMNDKMEEGTHFSTGSHLLLTSTPCHPNPPLLPTTGPLRRLNLNLCCLGRNHLLATFFSRWGKEGYSCNSQWPAITVSSSCNSQWSAITDSSSCNSQWSTITDSGCLPHPGAFRVLGFVASSIVQHWPVREK